MFYLNTKTYCESCHDQVNITVPIPWFSPFRFDWHLLLHCSQFCKEKKWGIHAYSIIAAEWKNKQEWEGSRFIGSMGHSIEGRSLVVSFTLSISVINCWNKKACVIFQGMKLDGTAPTILWGYGGFGFGQIARFNKMAAVFIEKFNGVYAVAHIRGGK